MIMAKRHIYEFIKIISYHPFESEITAALKTLVDKSPMVAFVTGHGERGCGDYSDKGYAAFAQNPSFRIL